MMDIRFNWGIWKIQMWKAHNKWIKKTRIARLKQKIKGWEEDIKKNNERIATETAKLKAIYSVDDVFDE